MYLDIFFTNIIYILVMQKFVLIFDLISCSTLKFSRLDTRFVFTAALLSFCLL